MKHLSKEELIKFARTTCSPLKKWVAEILIDYWDDYDDPKKLLKDAFNDAVMNGWTPLIYNDEFRSFYESYKVEISLQLSFVMEEVQIYSLHELFRNWDKTDPLAVGMKNQVILCSFAFEYGLEYVLAELGVDIWEE